MEDCLHTSSENLSKLVSWAHSHGTICSLIPNLKHLLSEGSHGNLTAMWGCSAGHAYHWPLTATCRAGSQERVCFQDNRSFNSDSPSIIGVPSETQTSPVERYPGRPVKAKLDCNRTRDSCDFSYCSEPSELDEAVEEYEDENTLFDMVCESSVTDEDSDFEPQPQRPQSIARKRPGIVPSSLHSSSQTQMIDECSSDVIIKKIKQEIPEDYYIVANAELTGGVDGPALSLTQMAKPKSQAHAGPSLGSAKLISHVTSAISTELDPHGVSASPSVMSRPVVQKTTRVSLASPNRGPPGAHGTSQHVAMQMPVSTSHPNKQISIPLSALQLPGQDEQVASEEFLSHLPSQVSSCEVALSPSVNTEPEVSSSQQQPPVAPTITTEATAQCIPAYSTKLNKFPVFNINDDLNDLCTSAVSPNTTKATRYALNVWRYWCMTNGLKDHTDITKIPAVKLNELLENFYVTVKKSDGSDFLATSLHAIRRGLDRILKNAGVGFSITSSTFSSSTKKLKEKLWVLSKAGMSGARSRNIVYFSVSDEEEMWQTGCLGDDSPITLLSTVVKYNSQYLNMRTLQEHADLMYGDIELLTDPQNHSYFARTDSVKRESRSASSRVCHGKIYHEHSRGHKQCPYCLLYKYMYVHRPPTQMEAKSPFYLTARKEAADMGRVWYEEQRMGLRSLRGVVPNLAKKVKLENCENFTFVSFTQVSRRLSSHSCCQ
ncbi:sorting nexin-30 isoform X2 [Budorcas taxicolor]|uniref:sorting nexin-30 isoform X2 n=1 Tax=Budorcas taxicolor TaxID=37181 RepID=UPI0022848EFD|nr:sorting nexin-30 isoform X2 [Budorcas taxicolor]